MKNIKQSIKNKAKATGEFISENKEIIIPVATVTFLGICVALKIKSNNNLETQEENKNLSIKQQKINIYTELISVGDNQWDTRKNKTNPIIDRMGLRVQRKLLDKLKQQSENEY